MNNTKSTTILMTLQLIVIASCHVLPPQQDSSICRDLEPSYICNHEMEALRCNAVELCDEYIRKSLCEKGPEVYCKEYLLAYSCDKEKFCVNWLKETAVVTKIKINSSGQLELEWDNRVENVVRPL